MADAYTEFLNMTKPEVGASRDTWGNKYNDNFGKVDAWAKATDALAKAAMPKAGGAFTGAVSAPSLSASAMTVSKAAGSAIYVEDRNGGSTKILYADADNFRVYDNAAAKDVFRVDSTGKVFTAQIPDLKVAIDAAAKAGNDALAKAVAKTGDTMTGHLTMAVQQAATAYSWALIFNNASVAWKMRAVGARLQYCDGPETVEYMSFGADGSISTRQFGDLNTRIENRASAFATEAANYRFHAGRLVFVGDLNQDWAQGGMNSPYGGNAVVTDRWTFNNGVAGYPIDYAKRFRQPQMYANSQGWVAFSLA